MGLNGTLYFAEWAALCRAAISSGLVLWLSHCVRPEGRCLPRGLPEATHEVIKSGELEEPLSSTCILPRSVVRSDTPSMTNVTFKKESQHRLAIPRCSVPCLFSKMLNDVDFCFSRWHCTRKPIHPQQPALLELLCAFHFWIKESQLIQALPQTIFQSSVCVSFSPACSIPGSSLISWSAVAKRGNVVTALGLFHLWDWDHREWVQKEINSFEPVFY